MSKDPRIGTTVANYKIESLLGGGGMGVVYKATDTRLNRVVALKFMPASLSMDEQSKARFEHEAQAAAALDHPRIGTIHGIGETDSGELFIAMAYYDGPTLKNRIDSGNLSVDEALTFARQIANGLKEAHDNGVVHRDVKPANVVITRDGFIKILDFGLAKLGGLTRITAPGTSMGTPAYMSPELAKGLEADHRCDIWALCVIMYEMFTRRMPFTGQDQMSMMYNIVHEQPAPIAASSDLPIGLLSFFDKAFNKNIDERHASIEELLTDLDLIQADLKPNTDAVKTVIMKPSPASGATTSGPPPAKSKKPLLLVAGLAVAAAVTVFYLGRSAGPPTANRPTDSDSTQSISSIQDSAYVSAQHGETTQSAAIDADKLAAAEVDSADEPVSRPAETLPLLANQSGDEIQAQPVTAGLIVTSKPAGASIYLNDSPSGQKTPFTFSGLVAGNYEVRVVLDGFLADSSQVQLVSGNEPLGFTLVEEQQATLSVSAVIQRGETESMAFPEIFIDGEPVGQAPRSVQLKKGEHEVEVKLFVGGSTKSSRKTVVVRSGEQHAVKFEFNQE